MLKHGHRQVVHNVLTRLGSEGTSIQELQDALYTTVIRQTGVKGFGLFAAEAIPRDALVATYGGVVLPDAEMCDSMNTLKLVRKKAYRYARAFIM